MSLAPGIRLGVFEVVSLLGEGGMGQVYRAKDTRLKRDVALKILPDAFATDPDRTARFQREAELLATLNHPNIATIYDVEHVDGMRALVLELVEGPTLADRIAQGPIPVDEALLIAGQIADALEAAHERGVIHRDLKPANIKLTPDDTVKVLDFGLAKAFDPAGQAGGVATMSPTLSVHATMAGVLLGTAAYMSPEQASGKAVDKRSDMWAFGVVLLEMLTGRRVFTGETTSHVLAAVLTLEPDWSMLPASTPPAVRRLLRRCLEKERRRRLADASDARLEIEDALASSDVEADASVVSGHPRRWLLTLVSGTAVLAVVTAIVFAWRDATEPRVTATYASLDAPPNYVLGEDDGLVSLPTRTPVVFTTDGRSLIIQAAQDHKPQLFIRPLDRPDARPIAGTEDARAPFVSPDGRWIGFVASGELRKVPVEGGTPTTICSVRLPLGPTGASWNSKDVIVFGDSVSGRIMRVSAGGGVPVAATPLPSARHFHVTPFFLPDGTHFLFSDVSMLDATDTRVMVQSLQGGEPRLVLASATDARLLPSGQLVFMRLGTMMVVPFDATRAQTTGDAIAVMSHVMQSGLRTRANANNTGAGMFAVSSLGSLVVVRGAITGGEEKGSLTWVTRDGVASSAEPSSGAPAGTRLYTRISPDGTRAVVTVVNPLRMEVWLADWKRDLWTACGECGSGNVYPLVWSTDGRRLLLSKDDTLVVHTVDGSARDQVVLKEEGRFLSPATWLADGRIIYRSNAPDGNGLEIKLLDAGATAGRVLLPRGPVNSPDVSPDGKWLAFTSLNAAASRNDVFVQPLFGPASVTQVSSSGGSDPAWAPDGRTLYYIQGAGYSVMFAVEMGSGNVLSPSKPRELFRRPDAQACNGRCFDVLDGSRFLMRERAAGSRVSVARMDLILNWTSTLLKN